MYMLNYNIVIFLSFMIINVEICMFTYKTTTACPFDFKVTYVDAGEG